MDIVCNVRNVNMLCHFVYVTLILYICMQMICYSLILVCSNVTLEFDFLFVKFQ